MTARPCTRRAEGRSPSFAACAAGAEIWTMNANGTGKRRLTQQLLRRRQPGVVAGRPADRLPQRTPIAPDVEPNLDIWVINADGTGRDSSDERRVRRRRRSRLLARRHEDRLSLLARNQSDIYVMNADGTNQMALTTDPADDFDVDWSPSGARLVFASDRNRQQRDLRDERRRHGPEAPDAGRRGRTRPSPCSHPTAAGSPSSDA